MLQPSIQKGHPNTISVILSNIDAGVEKDFRCVVCGKICFQYTSSVQLIIPGYEPIVRPPVIIQCNRSIPVTLPNNRTVETKCKTRYYVMG